MLITTFYCLINFIKVAAGIPLPLVYPLTLFPHLHLPTSRFPNSCSKVAVHGFFSQATKVTFLLHFFLVSNSNCLEGQISDNEEDDLCNEFFNGNILIFRTYLTNIDIELLVPLFNHIPNRYAKIRLTLQSIIITKCRDNPKVSTSCLLPLP